MGEDTSSLELTAPKLWAYLKSNESYFKNRKSIIYKKAPAFSIFGVGDYSFSRYKVGISGFYKKPIFSLLYGQKTVMTDDTSYYICFSSFEMAYVATLLLNTDKMQCFLQNISFQDAKRPYTKQVLNKIDFCKAVKEITFTDLMVVEKTNNLEPFITVDMFNDFKNSICA